jgi:hypothetical protein
MVRIPSKWAEDKAGQVMVQYDWTGGCDGFRFSALIESHQLLTIFGARFDSRYVTPTRSGTEIG